MTRILGQRHRALESQQAEQAPPTNALSTAVAALTAFLELFFDAGGGNAQSAAGVGARKPVVVDPARPVSSSSHRSDAGPTPAAGGGAGGRSRVLMVAIISVAVRMFDEDIETRAAAPIIHLDSDSKIKAFRFSNALMQRIAPNRSGLVAFYRAYHELCRRVTNHSAKATFRLQGGQVLVLAGHRVLHGRKAFTPDGRRHLQDAFFEHDNARNHLFVLEGRLAGPVGSES